MLLKDKTAVVTGCNKGIGKKILEVFSANGAAVFACVRNIDEQFESSIKELKKKFNKEIVTYVRSFDKFYQAEVYHQDFYVKKFQRYLEYKKACRREEILNNIWNL